MSSGFTKTQIIECARSQSEEGIANNNQNPAQWTNRVGTGFRIKPGDQITVHSSYISELGAQSGEIQIGGRSLGATVDVEVTNIEKRLPADAIPQKFQLFNASQITTTIDIRDDTLNLIVSPYKSANGENYNFLPRLWNASGLTSTDSDPWDLFDQGNGVGSGTAFRIGGTFYPRPLLNRCNADVQFVPQPYSVDPTISKVAGRNDGSRYTLFMRTQTFFGSPTTEVTVIGKATNNSSVITVEHGSTTQDLLVGMEVITQSPSSVFSANASIVSIDSSTTLTMSSNASASTDTHNSFTFQLPSTTDDQFLPPTSLNSSLTNNELEAIRDPAVLGDYIQIKNLIDLKVNPGYNSPTDVAFQLTEELNRRSDIEYFEHDFSVDVGAGPGLVTVTTRGVTSFKTESPCYKIYNCATATDYSEPYYDEFLKINGTWTVDKAYKYLSSYQHIGIKRPELYLAGKELNDPEGFPTRFQYFNFINDTVFLTGIEWNASSLLKFKSFFDTQTIYPELFEGFTQSTVNVSSADTRFFHMNLYDNLQGDDTIEPHFFMGANYKLDNTPGFGYDYYNASVSASQGSFPIFVDYNPDTVNFGADDVGYTYYGPNGQYGSNAAEPLLADYNDLAYGFGRKVKQGASYYIGFQFTRTNNKIPDHFFHTNASYEATRKQLGVGGGRTFGFDYHFSAYGTMAMMIMNGNADKIGRNRNGTSKIQYPPSQSTLSQGPSLEPYQFALYLGADSPIINYDDQQQRFQLSQFHTPELIGNPYNVGGVVPGGTIPASDDSDLPCYKINKRMLNTNWTPEMAPYQSQFNACVTAGSLQSFSSHNVNIAPYKVMDAHSGLFIEDWVVPEKYWNESLVGIMGFRYDQFHNPNTTNSRQVRLKAGGANSDLNNVNVITTNAIVNEADLVDYSKNIWGNSTYQRTIPVQKSVQTDPASGTPESRWITPAITISPAESVKINAQRLPTKTLRPYYTIRSDILSQNNYLGGETSGITLPIVSVTNKANPYGDYLNGIGSQITFTNTIDRVITDIRCSIHEPSGAFARVDNNSAVIFKIDQQINADLDLVGTLMASKNKKDQEQAQLLEDPYQGLENTIYSKDLFE